MWETIDWLRRTSVLLTGQLSTFVKVFPIFCLVLLPRLLGTVPLADAVADFALWPTKETHRQAKKLNTSFLDF